MYEKTKKIEQRQTNLENNIEEIKQLLLSRTETLTHPKDLPKLPLQAYADSKHLEEKINREESQKDYVVSIKKLLIIQYSLLFINIVISFSDQETVSSC
jgi:hypothetical protein